MELPRFAGVGGQPLTNVGREPVYTNVHKVEVQLFQLRLGCVAVGTAGDAVDNNLQFEIIEIAFESSKP